MAHSPDTDGDEVRGDMTPMIDCVFLMIVFFVCLDFRSLEAKLPSYLPRDVGSGPTLLEPREQLSVRVVCDDYGAATPDPRRRGRSTLVGHRVRWEVGPRTVHDLEGLRRELARLAADPAWQVEDPKQPGRRRLADCVVELAPGTVYDDAAHTADACAAAGFTELRWGGGLGARR